jgi:UDP-glucose 4-epimerase
MHGVDYVFHAAALKQVPSCEFFPLEAVKTNILGTENTLNAAIAHGAKKVICLSTDKAVYPINAMGMSKALMEKVFVAKARTVDPKKTLVCGTRYGNVMGSRGSVIPLFLQQIKAKQPLTVTDPEMTRYLMFIEEAVELVLYAFGKATQGDIFVQKAPACTIGTLAQAMKELFQSNSPIHVIGTRHGEKLYETLLTREEMCHAEDLGDHYRIPADTRDLNYEKYFETGNDKLSQGWDYTSHSTQRLSLEETKRELEKIPFLRKEIASDKGLKK